MTPKPWYYEGEAGYSITLREVEFDSEYAKECRKLGQEYLDKRAEKKGV